MGDPPAAPLLTGDAVNNTLPAVADYQEAHAEGGPDPSSDFPMLPHPPAPQMFVIHQGLRKLLASAMTAVTFGTLAARAITPLPIPEPSGGRPGFQRLIPESTGLIFQHSIPVARHLTNQMLLDGSGVALGDVDGDGRVDVFLAATGGGSQLWRNEGHWRFHNITSAAFPTGAALLPGDVTGAAMADLNGDGSLDLVLNTHGEGVRILVNDGRAVFRDLTFAQSSCRGGHSVALADVDGDGWVDLYVCNYRQRALMDMPNARAKD